MFKNLTAATPPKKESTEKLLVDVLKECTRVLEPPPRAGERAPSSDPPVIVHLVHNVSRPARLPAINV